MSRTTADAGGAAPERSQRHPVLVALVVAVVALALYAGGYAGARSAGVIDAWGRLAAKDSTLSRCCVAILAPAVAAESRWRDWVNARWLARNGARPGVTTTASGLQYEVIAVSTRTDAVHPQDEQAVEIVYRMSLTSGVVISSSGSATVTFPVSGLIKGFTESLKLMRTGDHWRIFIPPALGYGDPGAPPKIGPRRILVSEIELVKVDG